MRWLLWLTASQMWKNLTSNVQAKRFHENVFAPEFKKEEQVDLLVAGPPCQPYSSEGKRQGSRDPRAKVIYPIVEYAEERKPLMLLLENVPQWQTVGQNVFDEVLARLRAISHGAGGHYYNIYILEFYGLKISGACPTESDCMWSKIYDDSPSKLWFSSCYVKQPNGMSAYLS